MIRAIHAAVVAAALVSVSPAQAGPPKCLGQVVDAARAPIEGVVVSVTTSDWDPESLAAGAVARSGADGRFTWPASLVAAEKSTRQVVFSKAGYATRVANLTLAGSESGDIDLGVVVLGAGVVLQGVARRPDGQPVEGVLIEARDVLSLGSLAARRDPRAAVARARTDARGRFAIRGARPFGLAVHVVEPGFAPAIAAPVSAADPLVLEVERLGFVAGRVVDVAGLPLAGRKVTLQHDVSAFSSSAVTDDQGRFSLPLSSKSRWGLYAVPADRARRHLTFDDLIVGQGATSDVEVQIRAEVRSEPGRGLVVRAVADDGGAAVEQFDAAVIWMRGSDANAPVYAQILGRAPHRTATAARVVLDGPRTGQPKSGYVEVRAEGFATARVAVRWKDAADVADTVVGLEPESVVRGVVVDADTGAPVAGAIVAWAPASAPGEKGAAPDPAVTLKALVSAARQRGSQAVSSLADGSFSILGLSVGSYVLRATHDRRPDGALATIEAAVGVETSGVRLTIPHGATLRGKSSGEALPVGTIVTLSPTRGDVADAVLATTTASGAVNQGRRQASIDADGTFAIDGLAAGTWSVRLAVPPLPRSVGSTDVVAPAVKLGGEDLDIELDAALVLPGIVRGRVRSTDANVPSSRLVVTADDEPAFRRALVAPRIIGPTTFVQRDGTYALRLAPGKWFLRVVDAGTGLPLAWPFSPVVVAAGEEVEVELELAAVRAVVTLAPEDEDDAYLGERIEIRAYWPLPEGLVIPGIRANYDTRVGIDLASGRREHELWLPHVPVSLRLWSRPLESRWVRGGPPRVPAVEVDREPSPGSVQEIVLRVPRRQD